jgi:hypothetical protein
MKKSKRKLTKAQREKLARHAALTSIHHTMEELVKKLEALGDFDANAPHVRSLAAAVALLYRDKLKISG